MYGVTCPIKLSADCRWCCTEQSRRKQTFWAVLSGLCLLFPSICVFSSQTGHFTFPPAVFMYLCAHTACVWKRSVCLFMYEEVLLLRCVSGQQHCCVSQRASAASGVAVYFCQRWIDGVPQTLHSSLDVSACSLSPCIRCSALPFLPLPPHLSCWLVLLASLPLLLLIVLLCTIVLLSSLSSD